MKSIFLIALWGVGAAWPQAASNCQRSRNIRQGDSISLRQQTFSDFPDPQQTPPPPGHAIAYHPAPWPWSKEARVLPMLGTAPYQKASMQFDDRSVEETAALSLRLLYQVAYTMIHRLKA